MAALLDPDTVTVAVEIVCSLSGSLAETGPPLWDSEVREVEALVTGPVDCGTAVDRDATGCVDVDGPKATLEWEEVDC